MSQSGGWISRSVAQLDIPCVKFAKSRRGVVEGGLGSPLAGFYPNTEICILMISPKLLDICPVFLLVFSPIKTSDLLILLCPSGDGYSLLCSKKKQLPRYSPANLEICKSGNLHTSIICSMCRPSANVTLCGFAICRPV